MSNLNTYAGAFLGTVFVMMTVGILGEAIFHSETPEEAGFAIVAAEGEGGGDDRVRRGVGSQARMVGPAHGHGVARLAAAIGHGDIEGERIALAGLPDVDRQRA